MKVASVRRTAEFYYRRSTFHVHPVSSILTENRAALKESSFRSAKEIVCTDFGGGSLRSRLIVAAVLFVREASTIARRSRRLKRAINALETTDAPTLVPWIVCTFFSRRAIFPSLQPRSPVTRVLLTRLPAKVHREER